MGNAQSPDRGGLLPQRGLVARTAALRIYADTWTPTPALMFYLDWTASSCSEPLQHEVLVTRRSASRSRSGGAAASMTITSACRGGRRREALLPHRPRDAFLFPLRLIESGDGADAAALVRTARTRARRVVVVQQYDVWGADDDLVGRLYNHEAEARVTRIRVDFRSERAVPRRRARCVA